jgi:site-specific DNA-methyltransferase (adenine-specific)
MNIPMDLKDAWDDSIFPVQSDAGELGCLLDKVHNVDCIDLMRSMPSGSVNMIFADPPFNLNKKYSSYKDNLPFDEYMAWTKEWLTEACRIIKPDGSIFVYNIPRLLTHTSAILNELAEFRHWIAWNSNGQPLGKTLQPAHYGILFYTKDRNSKFYDVRAPHKTCRVCEAYLKDYGGKEHLRHEFGYQVSDVWDDIHRVRHRSKRIDSHPCQLPVHLIERMILMTTDEGDIIFDPFCGGGSAAIASKQLGRRYIGADIDEGYCDAAQARLEQARPVIVDNMYVSIHLKKMVSVRDIDLRKGKGNARTKKGHASRA